MKKIFWLFTTTLTFSSFLLSSNLSKEIQNSSLVVYNSNIGLVHEERELKVKRSDTKIIYEDVASSINIDSVNVKLDPSIKLFSQQYRFDSLTQAKLLETHIGKEVEVKVVSNNNKFKIIKATLLAANGSKTIVKTKNKKIITVKSENIIFKNIPDELILKPSLVWNIEAKKELKTSLELDYLIKNISFKSNYILSIDGNHGDLIGWITVDNRSGKRFESTKLSLLAGDINRVHKRPVRYKNVRSVAMMDTPRVSHKAYEGYHFYSIPFKVTLANNEKTQLKFLSRNALDITREYSTTLGNPLYLQGERKSDVMQYISFKALDVALPKGVVRTYSKLDSQSILLGETQLEHTPKNTDIKLQVGKNFDIKVTQEVLSRDDSKKWFDVEVKYSIKNSSNSTKTIELLVPFNKHEDSKIKTKHKYRFTKGNLVTFSLEVKANETKSFKVNFESKK